MLTLKLQRTDSFEKTFVLGKTGGMRRGRQRMRWLDGITDSMDMSLWVNSGVWWWTEKSGMLQSTGSQRVRHDWATELNWTKRIRLPDTRTDLWLPVGRVGERGMEWEFRVSRYKLLYAERINNNILLYRIEKYTQYSMISCNEKTYMWKEHTYVCILNHHGVQRN